MNAPALRGDPAAPERMSVTAVLSRSVLAGLAWWGLLAALGGDLGQLRYFSQVTTATVALAATASVLTWGVTAPGWRRALAWCRGASTTYAIVTAVIYQVLLSGNLEATSSLLEHAIVPILAVVDWVVFGPERMRQAWWTALSWLILPIGYLGVYYNVRDRNGKPLYPFLDPAAGNFWTWVGIMIAVFLAVGYLVWLVGRARRRPPLTAGG
ncbi:Pr6Pr family membrane protein [Nakamurella sp. GG22]